MSKLNNINEADIILINKERRNEQQETFITNWSSENHVYHIEGVYKF